MPFILKARALYDLAYVRTGYETTKNIKLNDKRPLLSWPTIFGGTNVDKRKEQIEFLEQICTILKPNILKEEEITTPEELLAHLTAARVMLAASMYIKDKIAATYTITSETRSVLFRQIDERLGITEDNYLDAQDKEICIYAARRFINYTGALNEANIALKKAGKKTISDKVWDDFINYVCTTSSTYSSADPYANYPITKVTEKLFGTAGLLTGLTVGYVIGDAITQSSSALSMKTKLTALVGGTLLLFNSTGPTGVALLAPVIADRLFNTFFKISFTALIGKGAQLAGRGLGLGVGYSLDTSVSLIASGVRLAYSYSFPAHQGHLSGLRLDGRVVIEGVVLKETPENELPPHNKVVEVEIREGKLYIDNKEVEVPEDGVALTRDIIEQLREAQRKNGDSDGLTVITEETDKDLETDDKELEKGRVATNAM